MGWTAATGGGVLSVFEAAASVEVVEDGSAEIPRFIPLTGFLSSTTAKFAFEIFLPLLFEPADSASANAVVCLSSSLFCLANLSIGLFGGCRASSEDDEDDEAAAPEAEEGGRSNFSSA